MNEFAERGAALLGGVLRHAERVSGGDLSQILRVTLEDGRQAIVKIGPHPETEAAMLRAIAASGAPAPAVLALSGELLVLELLTAGEALGAAWASLGVALATLHAAPGARYGWPEDYAFGPVAIENGWSDDWPRFWSERRLLTHCSRLPATLARRVEALAAALPDRLPAQPRPALLHGDLWSGNILAAGGKVSGLIDPACYHGHVEVDLAMLSLFDQPDAHFFDAYGRLEPGHEERRPIYMLWPALVHLRLFGAAYRPMVERLLQASGV
ncbi:fructosamine kinase family protein [Methylocella silvestris]|uniref:Aminoglycoside phosphotransferase n=1 Tax=Methylocella silvestris TaxID=199596 RepID=A0A2J7TG83_METSI|nr:fructosamine kinase family protein [Methylocella silvestris]PNG25770.1 aminoglycoside phosphotransferase [Methylocella silvestris]